MINFYINRFFTLVIVLLFIWGAADQWWAKGEVAAKAPHLSPDFRTHAPHWQQRGAMHL